MENGINETQSFTSYHDTESGFQETILGAIQTLPYPRSGANHVGGAELLLREIFRTSNGDRPSVPNVAIAVTATNPDRRQDEAMPTVVAMREAGVTFVLIKVTQHEGVTPEIVNDMRTAGVQLFLVDRFTDLGAVVDEVVDESCPEEGNVVVIRT